MYSQREEAQIKGKNLCIFLNNYSLLPYRGTDKKKQRHLGERTEHIPFFHFSQ